jgi:hypothetical protein
MRYRHWSPLVAFPPFFQLYADSCWLSVYGGYCAYGFICVCFVCLCVTSLLESSLVAFLRFFQRFVCVCVFLLLSENYRCL